jgi:hypothetical protein
LSSDEDDSEGADDGTDASAERLSRFMDSISAHVHRVAPTASAGSVHHGDRHHQQLLSGGSAAAIIEALRHAPSLPVPLLRGVRVALHALTQSMEAAAPVDAASPPRPVMGAALLPPLLRLVLAGPHLSAPTLNRASGLQRQLHAQLLGGLSAAARADAAAALLLPSTQLDAAALGGPGHADGHDGCLAAIEAASHQLTRDALAALAVAASRASAAELAASAAPEDTPFVASLCDVAASCLLPRYRDSSSGAPLPARMRVLHACAA